jgi:hypothetical protein
VRLLADIERDEGDDIENAPTERPVGQGANQNERKTCGQADHSALVEWMNRQPFGQH